MNSKNENNEYNIQNSSLSEYPQKRQRKSNINEYNEQSYQDSAFSDIYDIYNKSATVHSNMTDMTDDYTLSRYDFDIYQNPLPKFIREQRKVLRVIETYMLIPQIELKKLNYSDLEIEKIQKALLAEFIIIKKLIIGELDEMVIMARSQKGEVINAFLNVGLNDGMRQEIDLRRKEEGKNINDALTEKS